MQPHIWQLDAEHTGLAKLLRRRGERRARRVRNNVPKAIRTGSFRIEDEQDQTKIRRREFRPMREGRGVRVKNDNSAQGRSMEIVKDQWRCSALPPSFLEQSENWHDYCCDFR